MNKEELDLLEIVFTLAIGECAYNDINNIQKLEDKIKIINNLCKKQQEIIDKAIEYIKEKQKIQYKFALSHIECDDLLQILEDKEV